MPAHVDLSRLSVRVADIESDGERWSSIVNGLKMWWHSPVFGSGLGAFIATVKVEAGKALVIHNSAVWVLAELGLVGCIVLLGSLLAIGRSAWRESEHDAEARALVLLLITAAVFSLAHDIVYQRIVWLLLGATLATGLLRQRDVPVLDQHDVLVSQLRSVLAPDARQARREALDPQSAGDERANDEVSMARRQG